MTGCTGLATAGQCLLCVSLFFSASTVSGQVPAPLAPAPEPLRPQVVATGFPTRDVVVASIVIQAPTDGVQDATSGIQAAIDRAAAAGGAVVFLPAGRYRLEGRITLREGVTLRGDWTAPEPGKLGRGTILMPVADRGHADAPAAITIERGTGLCGVSIWYPEQDATAPVPYPWTIEGSTTRGGDNYTVENVTLVNPWKGIKVGPEGNELHTVRRVWGTPLNTGMFFDSCTDIGREVEVDFRPAWWEESGLVGAPDTPEKREALRTFLRGSAVGVEIGRSDWEYIDRVRIEGYAVGLRFRQGARGTTNAVMFGCKLVDCETALSLEKLNRIGLAAVGCRFAGRDWSVRAPAGFVSAVAQFNACIFEGEPRRAVALEDDGVLMLQNCAFHGWTETAIEATDGSLWGVNCDFEKAGRHVVLGEGVRRARLIANRFAGTADVVNRAVDGDVVVDSSPVVFDRPDVSPPPEAPDTRPANSSLLVVTDFGASPEADDNTAAFAKALDAARQAGGGTVYVPAGRYALGGVITVPTGVELRGIFDVPHHTQSAGSVLMTTWGHGEEGAVPFVSLERRSGLRGLTFWYPKQNVDEPIPYPWAVRSLGPGCWLTDMTMGNAWQGVDFWTHPSDGHVIRYLAGCYLRRGLAVSKCTGRGWLVDTLFNPHYAARLPKPSLPHPEYTRKVASSPKDDFVQLLRRQLDGLVFGHCEDEVIVRTFLYAANEGIAFRDDGGGANARILIHGTDTARYPARLSGCGERGLEFILAQLVPQAWENRPETGKKDEAVGGIVVDPAFAGRVAFFSTQMWGGDSPSAILQGRGQVVLQQMNTANLDVRVEAGTAVLESLNFLRKTDAAVRVADGCDEVRVLGVLAPESRIANEAGARADVRFNAFSLNYPVSFPPERVRQKVTWEPGETWPDAALAQDGGGQANVQDAVCVQTPQGGNAGPGCLRLAGRATKPGHAHAYFRVFDGPVEIKPETVLLYWIRPGNEQGRHAGIDLVFADGTNLRDSGLADSDGHSTHPVATRGKVGEWTRIHIPLGRKHAGRTIRYVMFAYDTGGADGEFEVFLDDLVIAEGYAKPASVQ